MNASIKKIILSLVLVGAIAASAVNNPQAVEPIVEIALLRKPLLEGQLGMWDALDSTTLDEQEPVAYRGNYYLLYAANHPGPRTGFRAIGVAMNPDPARFENADKLPNPVLCRNAERLARAYTVLLPSGEYAPWNGYYTTNPPGRGWMASRFEPSSWCLGEGGFGSSAEVDAAQIQSCRTPWQTRQIWVRREFDLPSGKPQRPVLNIRHEGAVQVFLNGKKIFESDSPSISYSYFDVSQTALFRPIGNILAVQAVVPKGAPNRFLDFGLLDAGDEPVEPTVYGVDDARIITGPNGFEKWMTYRAWWNGVPGTGLDRAFFFDDELVVDGPTTASTPGYHPSPAQPTFSGSLQNSNHWNRVGITAYLKTPPATHYLFEANLRFSESGKKSLGVVAWSNGEKDLIISINPFTRTWEYHIEPGRSVSRRFMIPSGFPRFEGHAARLQITKNGGHFRVRLNEFDLTPKKPITTQFTGAGVPGLRGAEADKVVYTVGWDEYDESINGWGAAADGTSGDGEWRISKDRGLEQRKFSEPGFLFKGDLLGQYEFTVNARTKALEEGEERLYGVFPVFADRNNYLKAMIDTRARQLVVSGRLDGRAIGPFTQSLQCRIPRQHFYDKNTDYLNMTAWVYGLRSQSMISGLDFRWMEGKHDYLRQEFFLPSDEMVVQYAMSSSTLKPIPWDDGLFHRVDIPAPARQQAGVLNPVSIRPVGGNYVSVGFYSATANVVDSKTKQFLRKYVLGGIIGEDEKVARDIVLNEGVEARPLETLVTLEVESSYFFRCVKLNDRVIIELNGRPMLEVEGEWPSSQVGLVTAGQPCFFNGIMLMHLPDGL